jgi:plastocyanin
MVASESILASSTASAYGSLSTASGSAMAESSMPSGMAGTVATHVVQVGGPNITFSPNNIVAQAGDLVQFQFHAKVSLSAVIVRVAQANGTSEPLRRPIQLCQPLHTNPEHHTKRNRRFLLRLHAQQLYSRLHIQRSDIHHSRQRHKADLVLLLAGQALPGRYGRCYQRVCLSFLHASTHILTCLQSFQRQQDPVSLHRSCRHGTRDS